MAGCNQAALVSDGADLRSQSDGPIFDPRDLSLADLTPLPPPDLTGADLAGADLVATDLADGGTPPDLFTVNLDALPSGVSQGPCHGCAWHRGQARCWGANGFGELGDDTRASRSTAAPVKNISNVVQISVGCSNPVAAAHTCAVTFDGSLYCWGGNNYGQIGDVTNMDQLTPTRLRNLPPIASVSLGSRHSTALATDGRVYAWGDGSAAQLGVISQREQAPVEIGLTGIDEISSGYFHGCARKGSSLQCWGRNAYGEVGNNTDVEAPTPVPVLGINDAVQVAAGTFHTCARRTNGEAWCWGGGEFGEMGNGKKPVQQFTPVKVDLPFSPVELSSTLSLCARDSMGGVYCWGPHVDQNGQTAAADTPFAIPQLSDARSLGGNCATRPGGVVSCWAFNGYGQVGDGTMTPRPSPMDVVGLGW